jgi:hypothetical protein
MSETQLQTAAKNKKKTNAQLQAELETLKAEYNDRNDNAAVLSAIAGVDSNVSSIGAKVERLENRIERLENKPTVSGMNLMAEAVEFFDDPEAVKNMDPELRSKAGRAVEGVIMADKPTLVKLQHKVDNTTLGAGANLLGRVGGWVTIGTLIAAGAGKAYSWAKGGGDSDESDESDSI